MFSQTTLCGRLGADPVMRTTQGGKIVASLSVATSYGYGEKEVTEWHNVVAWDKTAEYADRNLKKGDMVHLQGANRTRKYTDKGGVERYTTEVVMSFGDNIRKLGGGKATTQDSQAKPELEDDDIPF